MLRKGNFFFERVFVRGKKFVFLVLDYYENYLVDIYEDLGVCLVW